MRRFSPVYITLLSILFCSATFSFWAASKNRVSIEKSRELGLPILEIETEYRRKIKSKEEYLDVVYRMGDQTGTGKIRGRGNTTWSTREFLKKPYLLKLDKEASLAGLPAAQKWVLMANTADKTSLRNTYATYLAQQVWTNQVWVPKCTFITLFVNGRYEGLYGLTEKINLAPNRITLPEGSFLGEISHRIDKQWCFKSTQGVSFCIREPDASIQQLQAWQNIIQDVEDTLFSDTFTDAHNGYASVLDVDSFIDWYLINEYTKNHDAMFQVSCYFIYNAQTQKLSMGPIWDFDISSGNLNYDDCDNTAGFRIAGAKWYARLLQDPHFVQAVHARYAQTHQAIIDSVRWLKEEGATMKAAVELNDTIWRNIGHRQWPHAPGWKERKTYQAELDYLTTWLEARIAWLDTQYL